MILTTLYGFFKKYMLAVDNVVSKCVKCFMRETPSHAQFKMTDFSPKIIPVLCPLVLINGGILFFLPKF